MIEPENLSSAMDYLFEEKKDWVESFKILKPHKTHNFESLFLYHLIRKQVGIQDFKLVFEEVMQDSEPWQLKQLYNSFFNTDNKLGIAKYLNEDRYNNDLSDTQNMRYIFLSKENSKIVLEPTSLEYLKVFFSNNIIPLVHAGIAPFFYDLTPNLTSLKPILEILKDRPDGNKVLMPLFHAISTMSYDLSEITNKNSYNVLIETIPNIQTEFENKLVYKKSHPEPGLEINPSMMNFLNICQADVTKMINNRYQQEYEIQSPVDVSNKPSKLHIYYQEEPFVKLAISLSAGIEMGYKPNTPLDLSQIDINASALKNFVYLKTLETKLKSNEPVKVPIELCDYISAINKREKEALMPSISSFLDLDMMSAQVLHSRLDSSLAAKKSTKKAKI